MFLLDTERTDKLTSKDLFVPKNHDRMLNFFFEMFLMRIFGAMPFHILGAESRVGLLAGLLISNIYTSTGLF